jgi:Domain of Unknown Function (DUF1080)
MTMHRSDRRPASLTSSRNLRRALPIAAACAGMLATALATALGAGQAPKDQAGGPPGKRTLFDGKTLDGWKKTDFYHAGTVKVEDGRIVLATSDSMTGITTTRQDLPTTDYELTYEAMRIGGDDFFAAATFPVGKSYLTLVNGGWGGHVTGLSSLDGQDASENETTCSIKYQDKTWYRFRVQVTGEVIRCWVDDKQIIAVTHKEKHVGTRVETRPNEPLGFATWKTGGALRKIEVRPLSPDEIAATNKIE